MTDYPTNEAISGHDWEYKILRSAGIGFHKPERLREALAAEALAGWELVEKFDGNRIRLKRPTSRRQLDGKLEFDPYRTSAGSNGTLALVIVVALLCGLLAMGLALTVARSVAQPNPPMPPMLVPARPVMPTIPQPVPARPAEPAPAEPGPSAMRPPSLDFPVSR